MSDPDQPSEPPPALPSETGIVLLADPSDEGDLIAAALRQQGLSVVSSEVVALPERVSRLHPFAVVVDLEQPHVEVALRQLRDPPATELGTSVGAATGALHTLIVALGTTDQAKALGLPESPATRVVTRPVELESLASYLVEQARGRGSIPLPHAPSSDGSMPMAADSEAALLSDFPAIAGLPEVESILPDLEGAPATGQMTTQLSPEIEALLEAAASRVGREERVSESTQPQDLDILVPNEMLAVLDELAASDEESPPTHGMPAGPFGLNATPALELAPPQPPQPPLQPRPPLHAPEAAAPLGLPPQATATRLAQQGSAAHQASAALPPDEQTSALAAGTQVGPSARALESMSPRTSAGVPSWAVPPISSREPGADSWGPAPLTPSHAASTARTPWPAAPPEGLERPAGQRSGPAAPPRTPTDFPPSTSEAGAPGSPPTQGHDQVASTPQPGQLGGAVSSRRTTSSRYPKIFGTSSGAPLPATSTPADHGEPNRRHESIAPVTTLGQPALLSPLPPSSSRVEEGDPLEMLAAVVRTRFTGALVLGSPNGERLRRILVRDGDLVNAASEVDNETLLDFLVDRGDLSPEVAQLRTAKLPRGGRHAAAALIANGYLGQDDLWVVLRAHAEWIIARAIHDAPALCQLESEPPERLRAEPNVFGGAAGVEVFVESVRRAFRTDEAIKRMGGADAQLREGPTIALLAESALTPAETDLVRRAMGATVSEVLSLAGPELATVLFALVTLQILASQQTSALPDQAPETPFDPLDADAVRRRVGARLALVRDADYFALLGVEPSATAYQIRQAYLGLRRHFEPSHLLTAATADLTENVLLIVDVIEEAYEILRDPNRCRRYRLAIEATSRSPE